MHDTAGGLAAANAVRTVLHSTRDGANAGKWNKYHCVKRKLGGGSAAGRARAKQSETGNGEGQYGPVAWAGHAEDSEAERCVDALAEPSGFAARCATLGSPGPVPRHRPPRRQARPQPKYRYLEAPQGQVTAVTCRPTTPLGLQIPTGVQRPGPGIGGNWCTYVRTLQLAQLLVARTLFADLLRVGQRMVWGWIGVKATCLLAIFC